MPSDLDVATRTAPTPPPESPSINASFWRRTLTLLLYRISGQRWYMRRMQSPSRIRYVSRHLCIHCADRTLLSEARAMQMVAATTTIPVPTIYCSFHHRDRVFILMERLPGRPLYSDWLTRTPASRAAILEQLKSMVAELRAILPPTSSCAVRVASIAGGVFYDGNLPVKRFWGPYDSVQDFHRALRETNSAPMSKDTGDAFPGLRALTTFHDGPFAPPVFTHGDLSSFNILADGDKVTGIVDWETAT